MAAISRQAFSDVTWLKGTISQAFKFAKQQQTTSIDYHGVIKKAAEERLPLLIQSKLSRLLR